MSVPFTRSGQPEPLGVFARRESLVLPFAPLPRLDKRHSDTCVATWVAGQAAYRWFSVTGPAMKQYADRVHADFVVIDGFGGQPYQLSNKFRVRQIFDEYGYESVMFIDADALVLPTCPNYFELVPRGQVAILDEYEHYDEWARAYFRREAISLLLSQGLPASYGSLPTPKNTGVYVMHRGQRDVLTPPERPFPLCARNGATVEQTWFSLTLAKYGVPLFPLRHPEQHWMWYADPDETETGEASVLHFAGLRDVDMRYERLAHYASLLNGSRLPRVGGRRSSSALAIPRADRQFMLDNPAPPALRLRGLHSIDSQRSGWRVASKALSVLSTPRGVLCDTFIEDTFLWHSAEAGNRGILPYRQPWVGFIHNPPNVPKWPSIAESRIQNLCDSALWQESVPHCLGLYALTDYLARWVRAEWGLACDAVPYPTLLPDQPFSMSRFLAAERPILAAVGFWLRRFSSFERLPAHGYRKIRPTLLPESAEAGLRRIRAYEFEEADHSQLPTALDTVERVGRLSTRAYDDLLARCVVYLDLIDASGVTTIVECLVRGTPLLINPLPAVVEYLGPDYPLYFRTPQEAEEKIGDVSLIAAAHEHMSSNRMVARLSPQSFLDAVVATSIYRRALAETQISSSPI